MFTYTEEELEDLIVDWDIENLIKDKEKLFATFNYLQEKIIKRWPVISDYYTEGYHLAEKICKENSFLKIKNS